VPTQVSQPYRSTHRIGALGRVIHGSDELTDGIDVVPATNKKNLRRRELTLDPETLAAQPLHELTTEHGELRLVPEPAVFRQWVTNPRITLPYSTVIRSRGWDQV
jgi:hypothetical protein